MTTLYRTIVVSGTVDEADSVTMANAANVPKHARKASLKETVLMQKADSVKAMAEAAIAAATADAEKEAHNKAMMAHHHRRTSTTVPGSSNNQTPASDTKSSTGVDSSKQRRTSIGSTVNAEVLDLQNKLMIEEANHHKLVLQVRLCIYSVFIQILYHIYR